VFPGSAVAVLGNRYENKTRLIFGATVYLLFGPLISRRRLVNCAREEKNNTVVWKLAAARRRRRSVGPSTKRPYDGARNAPADVVVVYLGRYVGDK
jgi:hypothetical protein